VQDPFDPQRHREAWSAMTFRERRRIIKAVNRGQALPDAKDARLAVGVASNQMRFWRLAWLIGPAGALFQLGQGWVQFAINAVVVTAVIGTLSLWFHRRAARARAANVEVATTGRRGTRKHSRARDEPRPREVGDDPSTKPREPTGKFGDFRPDPNTSRKKVKRRKRRR